MISSQISYRQLRHLIDSQNSSYFQNFQPAIATERQQIEQALRSGTLGPVYGFDSLLGPLDSHAAQASSQQSLLRWHLIGEPQQIDQRIGRWITACKLKQLANGGSGISASSYSAIMEAFSSSKTDYRIDLDASYSSADVVPGAWWLLSVLGDRAWSLPAGNLIALISGSFIALGMLSYDCELYASELARLLSVLNATQQRAGIIGILSSAREQSAILNAEPQELQSVQPSVALSSIQSAEQSARLSAQQSVQPSVQQPAQSASTEQNNKQKQSAQQAEAICPAISTQSCKPEERQAANNKHASHPDSRTASQQAEHMSSESMKQPEPDGHNTSSILAEIIQAMQMAELADRRPQESVLMRDSTPMLRSIIHSLQTAISHLEAAYARPSANPLFIFENGNVRVLSQSSFLDFDDAQAANTLSHGVMLMARWMQRMLKTICERKLEEPDETDNPQWVQYPKVALGYVLNIDARAANPIQLTGNESGGVEDLWDGGLITANILHEQLNILHKLCDILIECLEEAGYERMPCKIDDVLGWIDTDNKI